MVTADAATATDPDGGTQPVTTFPPEDCQAGLPPSTAFHDVTFAELKRLNRTIGDLPFPMVLLDGNPKDMSLTAP